jgi:hypothetical protein
MAYRGMNGWFATVALVVGVGWPAGPVAAQCGGTCAQLPQAQGAIISWWPLDGNASDIVGGNSGSVTGGSFQAGEVCSAFKSITFTNRVRVPPNLNLNVATFTVEGWVRLDALNPFNPIVVWKGSSAANVSTSFGLGALGSGSTVSGHPPRTLWGLISDGGSWQVVYATQPLTIGAFTHVALTADGSHLCLYVNGVQQQSICPSYTLTPQKTSSELVIGALNNNQNQWNGLIDELTLYNRALTANEINSIHAAGSAGKCRCTDVAHYYLQQQLAANATIAAQQAQIASLQSRLNACYTQSAALDAAVSADGATPDAVFQRLFAQPNLAIPVATPIDQMFSEDVDGFPPRLTIRPSARRPD